MIKQGILRKVNRDMIKEGILRKLNNNGKTRYIT